MRNLLLTLLITSSMSQLFSQDDYFISEKYMFAEDSSIVLKAGMYKVGHIDVNIQNKRDSNGLYTVEYISLAEKKRIHQVHINRYANDSIVVWFYDIIKKRRRKEVCNTNVYYNEDKVVNGKMINDVMVGKWIQYDTAGKESGYVIFEKDMEIKASMNYDLIYEYVGKYYGIKSPYRE